MAAAALLTASSVGAAARFDGSAALTSDYVWRGTTQSRGDPAAQAGFKAGTGGGWYGAVWGSTVEFAADTEASSELDLTFGWSGALSEDWALDLNLTHYRYLSASLDLDWTEAIGLLTWKQNYWVQLGYSNDALASGETGVYAQLGAKWPLSDQVRLDTVAGYYALDGVDGDGYAHVQLGAVWAFRAPFELRLTAHATDSAAKTLFPGLAGSRVEAALQATF
ncbi:MAG TPA: TorF family putative porin [Dokdonella sp.]|nr:TorF family putative porin [Dokdonella sp.]